jgi:prophage maintenance system killer protein
VCQYLTLGELLEIHESVMEIRGTVGWLREPALLEAATARPRQVLSGQAPFSLIEKGACYVHSFATTQPFTDGNKGVALFALVAFMGNNGFRLSQDAIDRQGSIADLIKDEIAIGAIPFGEVAGRLFGYFIPVPDELEHLESPDSDPGEQLRFQS